MKNIFFIIYLFLVPTILFGQKKHIYKYEISLDPGVSHFSTQIESLKSKSESSEVSFKVVDQNEIPIEGVHITIEDYPFKRMETDVAGQVSILLTNKSYSFIVSHVEFTALKIPNITLVPESKTRINIILGYKNELRSGIIKSKKKLTKKEIKKITEDLSNENGENNPLIKNKICFISWII